jgi:2-polyprenyl-3-methyl-5-hydroxy-6-metoxy-1,4-benzoquinol methylase
MIGRNPSEIAEDGYKKIALAYHDQRDKFKSDELLGSFTSLLPPGGEVLNVGCGAGVPVVRSLVDAGSKVAAVDISSSKLEFADEKKYWVMARKLVANHGAGYRRKVGRSLSSR